MHDMHACHHLSHLVTFKSMAKFKLRLEWKAWKRYCLLCASFKVQVYITCKWVTWINQHFPSSENIKYFYPAHHIYLFILFFSHIWWLEVQQALCSLPMDWRNTRKRRKHICKKNMLKIVLDPLPASTHLSPKWLFGERKKKVHMSLFYMLVQNL